MFGGAPLPEGADQTSAAEKSFQRENFLALVDLLVAAGYYRARITGLSAFDKVVGGLCWCITSSGEQIDVDLLFQENSSIGARIALSESIVAALRQMGCPHALQAHQIQGGLHEADFPALVPVVIWLIKRFYENRERTKGQLRRFAQLRFRQRRYDAALEERAQGEEEGLALRDAVRAATVQRRFKRVAQDRQSTEESRVHAVLLEYGETSQSRYGLAGAGSETAGNRGQAEAGATTMADEGQGETELHATLARLGVADADTSAPSGFERKMAAAAKTATAEEARMLEAEAAEAKRLLEHMADAGGGVVSVAGGQVVTMLTSGSALSQAATEYEARMAQTEEQLAQPGNVAVGSAFPRQKSALKQRLKKGETRLELGQAEAGILRRRVDEAREKKGAQDAYNTKLEGEIVKLAALETGDAGRTRDLAALKRLVTLNEALKQQEAGFKASCKRQRARLSDELEGLKAAAADPQEARLGEIEAMHDKVLGKYDRMRQMLAGKNQAVADARRRIDDVPTRTELIQYERRFVELYAQVARKLEELKKFYAMHNVLEQKRAFLEKEVKLLHRVTEGFDSSMRGRQRDKDRFLGEFDAIIEGVAQQGRQQDLMLQERAAQVDGLRSEHQELVEQERAYFAAIKAFQEECERNEVFERRLQEVAA